MVSPPALGAPLRGGEDVCKIPSWEGQGWVNPGHGQIFYGSGSSVVVAIYKPPRPGGTPPRRGRCLQNPLLGGAGVGQSRPWAGFLWQWVICRCSYNPPRPGGTPPRRGRGSRNPLLGGAGVGQSRPWAGFLWQWVICRCSYNPPRPGGIPPIK